jgi:hypothetical protein
VCISLGVGVGAVALLVAHTLTVARSPSFLAISDHFGACIAVCIASGADVPATRLYLVEP